MGFVGILRLKRAFLRECRNALAAARLYISLCSFDSSGLRRKDRAVIASAQPALANI